HRRGLAGHRHRPRRALAVRRDSPRHRNRGAVRHSSLRAPRWHLRRHRGRWRPARRAGVSPAHRLRGGRRHPGRRAGLAPVPRPGPPAGAWLPGIFQDGEPGTPGAGPGDVLLGAVRPAPRRARLPGRPAGDGGRPARRRGRHARGEQADQGRRLRRETSARRDPSPAGRSRARLRLRDRAGVPRHLVAHRRAARECALPRRRGRPAAPPEIRDAVGRYVMERLLQALFVVFGITTVVFFILRATGDPVLLMVMPGATTEQLARLRHAFGFDRPLLIQYLDFLSHAARGDFGLSIRHQEPALALVLGRVPAPVRLAAASRALAVGVALVAGVVAASRRGSWLDVAVTSGALLGQSVPGFWLGIMLIMVFSVRLRWLPSFGMGTSAHLVLPALTLSAFSLARLTRLVRAGMLDVLGQEYIRTARAKGLADRLVVAKHALRNVLLPVITLVGLDAGFLLGGAIIVETIFAWPGMGQLALQAVYNRDFPLVQANVIFLASAFVVLNLGVDLLYPLIDPKVRYREP